MEKNNEDDILIKSCTVDFNKDGTKSKVYKYDCDDNVGYIIVFDFEHKEYGHLIGLGTKDNKGNVNKVGITIKEAEVLVKLLKKSIRNSLLAEIIKRGKDEKQRRDGLLGNS